MGQKDYYTVRRYTIFGTVSAGLLILLSLIVTLLLTTQSTRAVASVVDNNTMVIRSFPAGFEVRVVPQSATEGPNGNMYMVTDDYLVGITPVETPVDPGDYQVYITIPSEESIDFRADGETGTIQHISAEGSFIPGGKVYSITKRADHQAVVTALFWPKDQSLADFVATLPGVESFVVDETDFNETFAEHGAPPEDWPFLLKMLRVTGKAVWYSADSSEHLYVYFISPDAIVIDPSLSDQPN